MADIVELELSRAVNVTTTDYIRAFIAERIERDGLAGPAVELVHFNVVILCTRGSGTHMVDFEDLELTEGTAVWVRPGQVQRWSDTDDDFDATVVVFDSGAVPELPLFEQLVPSTSTADLGDDSRRVRQQMDWLASDLEASDDEGTAAAVVGVILRLYARHHAEAGDRAGSQRRALAEAFVESVEANLGHRTVAWHARHVGSSTRTITRATTETLGQRPKEIIDAAVMLEARRRLAWSNDDIGTIGRALRFSDASNFTKFFRERTGVAPSAFRESLRSLDP